MATQRPTPLPTRHPTEGSATLVNAAPPPKLLLTVEQAAERLGIGRTTMYALIKTGAIESVPVAGRLRRIPPDALETYIANLREMAGAA